MAASMNNVRVKLSLANPSDNCWFLINTDDDYLIGDVERRINTRFCKDGQSPRLFLDGCLLPSEERTLVLRDNDKIDVRYTKLPTVPHSHCEVEPLALPKSTVDVVAKHKKDKDKKHKRSLSDVEHSDNEESRSHKKKHKKEHKKKQREPENEKKTKKISPPDDLSLSDQESEPKQKHQNAVSTQEAHPEPDVVGASKDSKDNQNDTEKVKKKKRTRRKRKTSTKTAIVVSELCGTSFAATPRVDQSLRRSAHTKSSSQFSVQAENDKKHVRFDSDDDLTETPTEPTHTETDTVSEVRQSATPPREATPTVTETPLTENSHQLTSTSKTNKTAGICSPQRSLTKHTQRHEVEAPRDNGLGETDAQGVHREAASVDSLDSPHSAAQDGAGYKFVPPPTDYRTPRQVKDNRRSSPAGLLQGAQVFNRRRCKKNAYHPLSKEEQLNTTSTNVSANASGGSENGVHSEKPPEIRKEPPKDYASMEQFHSLPRKQDRIAFKVLEISNSCTPELSAFQEATVIGYDPVTKMVDLEMAHCTKEQRKPSRFDLIVEDEEEILTNISSEDKKSLLWQSLVDVRLVPAN